VIRPWFRVVLAARWLEGQHPLPYDRHALLAVPSEQAMRQQLHPLAQRRVFFVEPIDLAAEFVEDCLGLCTAYCRHVPPSPEAAITAV
jgi:hypothetical protein